MITYVTKLFSVLTGYGAINSPVINYTCFHVFAEDMWIKLLAPNMLFIISEKQMVSWRCSLPLIITPWIWKNSRKYVTLDMTHHYDCWLLGADLASGRMWPQWCFQCPRVNIWRRMGRILCSDSEFRFLVKFPFVLMVASWLCYFFCAINQLAVISFQQCWYIVM